MQEESNKMRAQIEFAEAIASLIKDPRGIAEYDLKTLVQRFNQAQEYRTKGYFFDGVALEKAREGLIQGLMNIVKLDIAPKKELDGAKEQLANLSTEIEKVKVEGLTIQQLTKEVKNRDTAVRFVSEGLFPIKQKERNVIRIQCPKCETIDTLIPNEVDSENLLQKGYIISECGNCKESSNHTFYDMYKTTMKFGFYLLIKKKENT
jgi:hypothetical protein